MMVMVVIKLVVPNHLRPQRCDAGDSTKNQFLYMRMRFKEREREEDVSKASGQRLLARGGLFFCLWWSHRRRWRAEGGRERSSSSGRRGGGEEGRRSPQEQVILVKLWLYSGEKEFLGRSKFEGERERRRRMEFVRDFSEMCFGSFYIKFEGVFQCVIVIS